MWLGGQRKILASRATAQGDRLHSGRLYSTLIGMSDIVFILGAGASFDCGGPLMANFLDRARTIYAIGEYGYGDAETHKARFGLVFETIHRLQYVHSKAELDLHNIESIFTAIEMGKTIGALPDTPPERIEEIVDALKHLIVVTLQQSIRFPVKGSTIEGPASYAALAKLVDQVQGARPRRTASIITFNYDVGLDVALCRRDRAVAYGIAEPTTRYPPVRVHKLHGSLNWAQSSDETIRVADFHDYFRHYQVGPYFTGEGPSWTHMSVGSHLVQFFNMHGKIEVKPEPVIVPPSWNKADHYRTISKVWANAAQDLREATEIYVMGYSLPDTDQFFRLLYALGTVGGPPLMRFEVFDPDTSDTVQARFRNLLGSGAEQRFKYHALPFDQATKVVASYHPVVKHR